MSDFIYTVPTTRGDIVAALIDMARRMEQTPAYHHTNIYRRAVILLATDHDEPTERETVPDVLDHIADVIDRTLKAPHDTLYRRAAAMIREDRP